MRDDLLIIQDVLDLMTSAFESYQPECPGSSASASPTPSASSQSIPEPSQSTCEPSQPAPTPPPVADHQPQPSEKPPRSSQIPHLAVFDSPDADSKSSGDRTAELCIRSPIARPPAPNCRIPAPICRTPEEEAAI